MTSERFHVNSAAVSDRGLSEKRPQNEDSFLLLPDSGMFAVADGVGGAQAGDVASQMAVEILGEAFENLQADGDPEERMRAAIEQANTAIFQMSRDIPQLSTMATTLVAIHISGNIVTIGHVGDSRLYRIDEMGDLYRETQDHSIVEEEVRAGRMTPEQARIHPSRNVISRALGAEFTVDIDMKTIMFVAGTSFLICSDGVTRHIPDDELRDIVVTGEDSEAICSRIKELCYERGAEDNLTAVVVKTVAFERDLPAPALPVDETETVATARVGSSNDLFAGFSTDQESRTAVEDVFELDDVDDLDVSGVPAGTEVLGLPDEVVQDERFAEIQEEETIDLDADGEFSAAISAATAENASADMEDDEEIVIPLAEPSVENAEDSFETGLLSETGAVKDVRSYRVDESSGNGMLGKVVSGLAWLIVGTLLGVLGYYMYSASTVPVENIPAQTNKTVLDFEQRRRLADADPAKYLAGFGTKPEQTAADHYLIGRAYLVQKNYGAAKSSFEQALGLLDKEEAVNRAVLEFDVSAGLSIARTEAAQKVFEEPSSKDSAIENGVNTAQPEKDSAPANN